MKIFSRKLHQVVKFHGISLKILKLVNGSTIWIFYIDKKFSKMNKMLFKNLRIKRIIGLFYNLNLMIKIRKKLDKIIFKMIM